MPDTDVAQFNSPIPGQSLTQEVGSRPWERPAQYSTPEEALDYYLEQMAVPEKTVQMLEILEGGFPVADLTDAITLGGVMQGLHSVDVAVIIAPVIFEVITSVAENAGIEYEEGLRPSEKNRVHDDSLIASAMRDSPEERSMEKAMSEEGEKIGQAARGLMATQKEDSPEVDLEEMV